MASHKKAGESSNETLAVRLKEVAWQLLAENGEKPDHWLITARKIDGKLAFLCATPPFALLSDYAGPLLDQIFANHLSLAVLLTVQGAEVNGLACVGLGLVAAGLADAPLAVESANFPPGFAQVTYFKRQPDPLLALRTAIREMLQLGYQRLALPFTPSFSPASASPVEIKIRPDGGMTLGAFQPTATYSQLNEALSASAGKAKLTRLRQGAKNCGGCGRCCHDADIPLTYFDLRGVASQRFAERFARQPESAIAEAQKILAATKPATPGNLIASERLFMRKKDGTSDGGSSCIFLDSQGLCGVYFGRPLLCRLYHCASSSPAVELLTNSVYYNIEWLGRAVASDLFRLDAPVTHARIFEQPLIGLSNPYALSIVEQEINGRPTKAQAVQKRG